jgi:hypothetical protein
MFDAFDSNGDGTIDLSEFPRLGDAIRRSAAKTTTPKADNRRVQPVRLPMAAAVGGGGDGSSGGWRQSNPSLGFKRQPPSLQTMAVAMRAMTPPRGQKRAPPPLGAASAVARSTSESSQRRPRPLTPRLSHNNGTATARTQGFTQP